jgi:hypothetical protein
MRVLRPLLLVGVVALAGCDSVLGITDHPFATVGDASENDSSLGSEGGQSDSGSALDATSSDATDAEDAGPPSESGVMEAGVVDGGVVEAGLDACSGSSACSPGAELDAGCNAACLGFSSDPFLGTGQEFCTSACTPGPCIQPTSQTVPVWAATGGDDSHFSHDCGISSGTGNWGAGPGENGFAVGCLMQYGPYLNLPAGTYSVQVDVASGGGSSITIQAIANDTTQLSAAWTCPVPASNGWGTCSDPNTITLTGCQENVEIDIWFEGANQMFTGQTRIYKIE